MRNWVWLLGFLLFVACGGDDADEVQLPSQLQYDVMVSTENEGEVTVQASAQHVNYYSFLFYDEDEIVKYESNDGLAIHTFASTGAYQMIVRAHALANEYIELIDTIEIFITPPLGGIPGTGYSTPLQRDGYTLFWNDEFDGSELSSDWSHKIGTGNNGWGNNELQYYRDENTKVSDGYLTIEARNESYGGRNYTSSRITTEGLITFQYGRVDIRAALPKGKGIWPALWMLGESFATEGWPGCGELDIMEMVGGNDANFRNDRVYGTVHWLANGQRAQYGGQYTLSDGIFADEFHVFSIEWDETYIRWYVDDKQFHVIDIRGVELTEFHQPYFFLFNIAVGGNWPGNPDGTTVFPQAMHVDYVRVYKKN